MRLAIDIINFFFYSLCTHNKEVIEMSINWKPGFEHWARRSVGDFILQDGVYTTKFKSWYKKEARKHGAIVEFKNGMIIKVGDVND